MKTSNRVGVVCLTFTGLMAALAAPAFARPLSGGEADRFVETPGYQEFSGSMIARPRPVEHWRDAGLDAAAASARRDAAVALLATGFEVTRHEWRTDQYVFRLGAGETENAVADELLATGLFEFVEPNWIVYPLGNCPNDSQFNQQWYHDVDRFDSCVGWQIHTGMPEVTVGVCDTGVRVTHEDLQLHRKEGYNAVDRLWENQGGRIEDIYGHGTEATGCAAANGNNGIGVTGMGWNLSHRMLRVTNSSGGGSSIDILNHAALTAIENGDKVASLSYSGVDNDATRGTATEIKNLGGLMIWAAGNSGFNMSGNGRDEDDVIIVGAVSPADERSWFSNYGRMVDLVAPGEEVWNVSSTGDNHYRDFSGTSAACPQVSGLAALIWSADPSLSPDEVEDLLKATCDDLGTPGLDDTFGYGRINLGRAITTLGGGLRLTTNGACPGEVTVSWSGATPDRQMAIVYAATEGNFEVVSGPCAGAMLGLGSTSIQIVQIVNTGATGSGEITGQANSPACGGFLQLVVSDVGSCPTSNVAQLP